MTLRQLFFVVSTSKYTKISKTVGPESASKELSFYKRTVHPYLSAPYSIIFYLVFVVRLLGHLWGNIFIHFFFTLKFQPNVVYLNFYPSDNLPFSPTRVLINVNFWYIVGLIFPLCFYLIVNFFTENIFIIFDKNSMKTDILQLYVFVLFREQF